MLKLREFETRTVELSPNQAAELAQYTRGSLGGGPAPRVIQQLTPSASPGCYDIQPGPFVGRFSLASGLTVDIASRFPFENLVEVLRVSARHPALLRLAPVPAQRAHGLLEIIAAAFVRELRRIVGFGLVKGYTTRVFTRPPYPGTLDANAHLARHLGRPDRLVTRARRMTTDIAVNQVLGAALRILLHQNYVNRDLPVQLRALAPVFTDITAVPDALRLAPKAALNLPDRYQEAFGLALIVASGSTALPMGAGNAGSSVLFSMPKVWESYLQAVMEPRLPPGHRLSVQHPVLLTTDGSEMRAAADLVEVDAHGRPLAVYDAKYKPWGEKPSADELYQVVTYAYRLGLDSASLLYPGRGETSQVAVGRYRVHSVGVDVLRPPSPSDDGH